MAIHFPERKYLNFAELQARWQADPNDIRVAIASGALKVSMHFKEQVTAIKWLRREHPWGDHEFVPEPVWDEDAEEMKFSTNRWFYLQEPRETGPFACTFRLISLRPRPPKEGAGSGDWYSLGRDISLTEVEANGVFMFTEIASFENSYGEQPPAAAEQESPLQTRERNSLLLIIALLTEAAGLDIDANSKNAGIIESAAAAKGLTLSRRAIDNHLKRARETLPIRSK